MQEKIRILIADDNEAIQTHFQNILNQRDDIEVCGLASSGREAVQLADTLKPDIILMDIQMESELAGIEAIGEIKKLHPEISIIVCTMYDDDDYIYEAFGNGATDYITKSSPSSMVLNSIYSINKNRFRLNEQIASRLLLQFPKIYKRNQSLLYSVSIISKLSKSEYEILKYIHDGLSYREIAALRHVEEPSIRVQISRILKKFNKPSTKELMKELDALSFFDIYDN
ncbi:MAG: response regulator transcription factor [Clostridia bacterium]|nr:response regulator transcription factor [Clostridia bacterium]